MTTFVAVAENSKLEIDSFSSEATGKLEKVDGKFMISEVELKPTVKIKLEKDRERAERIIQKAENLCLISNSAKSKIILTPQILI